MGQVPWWERLGVPWAIAMQRQEAEERRALVISHNAFLRRVVSEFLDQAGAFVETRASIEQALERPVQALDLVLCDYPFPQGDGLALLKQIRTGRTGFPQDVPFVLMAEAAERWLVEAAVGLDADGCVLLPINAQKIEDAMHVALKRERVLAQVDDYEEVATEPPRPAASTRAPETAQAAPGLPGCFARAVAGARMVPVDELAEGMVLGADLQSERGVVLLPGGVRLDAAVIGRLRSAARNFGFEAVPVGPGAEGGA